MTHQEELDRPVGEQDEAWARMSCRVHGIDPDVDYVWETDGVTVARGPAWRAALLVREGKCVWE